MRSEFNASIAVRRSYDACQTVVPYNGGAWRSQAYSLNETVTVLWHPRDETLVCQGATAEVVPINTRDDPDLARLAAQFAGALDAAAAPDSQPAGRWQERCGVLSRSLC
ncbi:hypothetical protein [Cellulomonas sp. IC4_254]|uniref:hypothetical protein n=1 Tax=Cellulomonas sp. IC4_254 TaxID=2714040 RepID=UPI0014200848|nr:hypothetical protein [Cellulomonas sp. IC4_254]NHT17228.1 hypothetical protein [Cellulomonas sp. IC4_254]